MDSIGARSMLSSAKSTLCKSKATWRCQWTRVRTFPRTPSPGHTVLVLRISCRSREARSCDEFDEATNATCKMNPLPRSISSARTKVANSSQPPRNDKGFQGRSQRRRHQEHCWWWWYLTCPNSSARLNKQDTSSYDLPGTRIISSQTGDARLQHTVWTGVDQNSKRRPAGMQAGVLLVICVTVELTVSGRRREVIAGTDISSAGTRQCLYEVVIYRIQR
jgi:hypothetical protein